MVYRIRVWDLPTRLFHWLLALAVVALVASAQLGRMELHMRLGYAVAALLLFRLLWGLFGGYWSRFVRFLYTPAALWRYLRGRGEAADEVGHSPLGALSVWALLLVLLVQVGTGLISDDEIAVAGPLAARVSSALSSAATSYHRGLGKWLLIALVSLHVLAVLYYLVVKRRNLIRPMIAGDKLLAVPAPASADGWPQRLLAVGLALLAAGAVTLLVQLA
ncbi:MAG: cytochrome b/b6 domain-containing protein [Hylemonella sp.]